MLSSSLARRTFGDWSNGLGFLSLCLTCYALFFFFFLNMPREVKLLVSVHWEFGHKMYCCEEGEYDIMGVWRNCLGAWAGQGGSTCTIAHFTVSSLEQSYDAKGRSVALMNSEGIRASLHIQASFSLTFSVLTAICSDWAGALWNNPHGLLERKPHQAKQQVNNWAIHTWHR